MFGKLLSRVPSVLSESACHLVLFLFPSFLWPCTLRRSFRHPWMTSTIILWDASETPTSFPSKHCRDRGSVHRTSHPGSSEECMQSHPPPPPGSSSVSPSVRTWIPAPWPSSELLQHMQLVLKSSRGWYVLSFFHQTDLGTKLGPMCTIQHSGGGGEWEWGGIT